MNEKNGAATPKWMMVAVRPEGRRVIIVGSGRVARRRAEQFVARGAQVEIYDPSAEPFDADLPPEATLHRRELARNDLNGAWLAVVATDDETVNAKVGKWAEKMGVSCNRTDDAESGTFAVPATLEDDLGWKVAVLGGDAGPLFSAWVKGMVGQMATSERIGQVYTSMAAARFAAETLQKSQQERAFLLRKAMTRILETTHEIDGAALIRKLAEE